MTFFGSLEYTVSKHGVAGLNQHLAWELADSNITVNTVCPGGVHTPLMEASTTPEYRAMTVKRLIPLGRFTTIEEIGEAVSFLASDRAATITGQTLAVDGGLLTGFGEDLRAVVRKRMEAMTQAPDEAKRSCNGVAPVRERQSMIIGGPVGSRRRPDPRASVERSHVMTTQTKRIAVNFGGGYVPGLNAVITGAVLAASELGWEVVGIRDGYEGLLFPDRYPDGGLVRLTPQIVENLAGATGCILGTAAQSDPFHVRTLNAENRSRSWTGPMSFWR